MMTEQEVIDLMESSQSSQEWNANCDKVKKACNGYPEFWFKTMLQSGRANQILNRWGSTANIQFVFPERKK